MVNSRSMRSCFVFSCVFFASSSLRFLSQLILRNGSLSQTNEGCRYLRTINANIFAIHSVEKHRSYSHFRSHSLSPSHLSLSHFRFFSFFVFSSIEVKNRESNWKKKTRKSRKKWINTYSVDFLAKTAHCYIYQFCHFNTYRLYSLLQFWLVMTATCYSI